MPHPPHVSHPHNGDAIRVIRKLRGTSMKELSKAVGIQPQSLSGIELERKAVSLGLLNRIALALEVPLSALSRVRIATGERDKEAA